jgi:hypothetical protein
MLGAGAGVRVGTGAGVLVGIGDGTPAGAGVFVTMSTALAAPGGSSTVLDGSSYFVNVIDIAAFAHELRWYVVLS